MKATRLLLPILAFILPIYTITSSCKAGRAARNMLPEQFTGRSINEQFRQDDHDDSFGLPFYIVDTTVDNKAFTAIYLRNPDYDSLAFSIIKSYEPFANSLLHMATEQGIHGLLIDFREDATTASGHAGFSVFPPARQGIQHNEESAVSVNFLWDESSASRATDFMNALSTSPSVSVKAISSTGISPSYRQDCFKAGSPSFDN